MPVKTIATTDLVRLARFLRHLTARFRPAPAKVPVG
jgi:hypothetical protein